MRSLSLPVPHSFDYSILLRVLPSAKVTCDIDRTFPQLSPYPYVLLASVTRRTYMLHTYLFSRTYTHSVHHGPLIKKTIEKMYN